MTGANHALVPAVRGRRRFIGGALAGWLAGDPARSPAATAAAALPTSVPAPSADHAPFGPLAPVRPLPAWPVTTHDGRRTDLAALLTGRVSALQLMFTGCSATCPLQGALFAQAQQELQGRPAAAQFVSVSIDALGDTPAALDGWLRKFGARPGWLAALPGRADVGRIVELLGSGGENRPRGTDPHTGQVYIVDRRGALVYRTPSMPPPAHIVAMLRAVDARA